MACPCPVLQVLKVTAIGTNAELRPADYASHRSPYFVRAERSAEGSDSLLQVKSP